MVQPAKIPAAAREVAALAKYVFYTATGLTLSDLPKKPDPLGFIGETDLYRCTCCTSRTRNGSAATTRR